MVKRPLKVLRIAAALYKPIYLIEAESGKVVKVCIYRRQSSRRP
jgi:hypothetical protein